MASQKETSSPLMEEELQTHQREHKRLFMPNNILEAAINGNESYLKELLRLVGEQDHRSRMDLPIEDVTSMDLQDCLRSTAGMGNTILHILSANGHAGLVSTICQAEKSLLKACNARDETPFHHAARFGHELAISKMIEHANSEFGDFGLKELLRQKNCLGDTALHEAARHGHRAVVSVLMEADQELAGHVNLDSVSPLYLATARGSVHVVKEMVRKMCNYRITTDFYSGPKQQTALHAAVLQQPELIKELLNLYSGPFGKKADDKGRTPLHFVATLGDHNLAQLLLDKDLSLAYMQDLDGSFPVHVATRMGHVEMLALLLQRCLDSGDLVDHSGRNFLHIAAEANKSNVIFKLRDSKNKIPVQYWKKILNRMVNTVDNNGNTPLHVAARHGHFGVMVARWHKREVLDLTLPNNEGLTALDLVVVQLRESGMLTMFGDFSHIMNDIYVLSTGGHSSTGWFEYYTKKRISKAESSDDFQDHIPKEESRVVAIKENILKNPRGANTSLESKMAKAQIIGLGSVLIATITFAAAFTLPGGTNQDTGTAIQGGNYFFKAFVIANFAAFCLSFVSTQILILSTIEPNPDKVEKLTAKSISTFFAAAKCMVMALALGLYVVLAPVSKTALLIFLFSLLFISFNPVYSFRSHFEWSVVLLTRKHPCRACAPKYLSQILFVLIKQYFVPVFAPLIFVFLFALV